MQFISAAYVNAFTLAASGPLELTVCMSQPPDLTDSLTDWKPRKTRSFRLRRESSPKPPKSPPEPRPESRKPRRGHAARSLDTFLLFAAILLGSALLLQAVIFFALA